MYLLDTNILIYFFKGMGEVASHLFTHEPAEIAIPAIVQYEIETGIAKSQNPDRQHKQFHELLSVITVIPFDSQTAKTAGELRAMLEHRGAPIGPYDILIAGTAATHHATLVTHNTAEFSRIDQLTLEDWYN